MSETKPGILVVDDVEANLVAVEALLNHLDCEIVRASSGNEALRQLLKREFAVVLLDVQMPEISGYEVARFARDNPATRDVPIIFVTAMQETEEKLLEGYSSGAVDFLFKPINPYILRSKVQVFLELYLSRRRLADEIEAHKKTLAELEAFSYSVSHDLRAPLRAIDGFSQAFLEDYADRLDVTGQNLLRRVRAAAQRMAELIDDMLQLSRVTRAELHRSEVDLSGLARLIAAELQKTQSDREVEFTIEDGLVVQGDARLLRIALENLLSNAWKFTGKRERAKIEVGVAREQATYFVRDNGAGFDMHYAGKLFTPFQRLHSEVDFEGTGIGLATVRRIIRRHGGRVWAEGVPGSGATFYFTLQ